MGKFDSIIQKMTVEEKLGQMSQLMAECFGEEDCGTLMGISYGFEVKPELAWNLGSVLGMSGAKRVKDVQKTYLEKSTHKIPLMFMHDVIHGFRTSFPSPIGMACTWEPELVEKASAVAAKEASVSGVHLTFSPMADLARDARWGRVIEGNGEDPLLNCQYSVARVKGYQGDNIRDKYRMASCVKHFAGYGAAESGRDYNTTEISDYQLKESYLPAYKAAIDAGCKMVMTAFNALNGVPCTGNKWLYEELLRGEWGFKGSVITDCTALYELIPHGYAENPAQAAKLALETGVDIEMVSTAYFNEIPKLIAEGKIDEALLDTAVERILELKEELGLFENPYKDADEEEEKRWHVCAEHRALAREIAARSMVLLKNDNHVLPIQEKEKVALVGPFATTDTMIDIWKCMAKPEECVTFFDGMKDRVELVAAEGCAMTEQEGEEALMAEAVEAAKQCDTVILALGEHPSLSAEAGSRAYLTLPENQQKLAKKILELGKKTVLVLFNGRPLELGFLNEEVDSILVAWYPGTEAGNALADVLLGDVNPSGRLSISFPYTLGQVPIYYNALPTGRPKGSDDNPERFTSRYVDAPNDAAYPFGYGLSYGEVSYGELSISNDKMTAEDTITATMEVTNLGDREVMETVQLYLRDMGGSYSRPVKMLKDYQKITLQPGEKRTITFNIDAEMLKYNTRENGYTYEEGTFRVFVGPNSSVKDYKEFVLVS